MNYKKEHQKALRQVNKYKSQILYWQESYIRQGLSLKTKNEELESYKMMCAENIEMYKNAMKDKLEVTHQLEKLQLELSMDAELDTTEHTLTEWDSEDMIQELQGRGYVVS